MEALRSGADVVVMVHPDNQYDSTLVPQMIEPILDGRADIVLGSRFLSGTALSGGMPWWKFVSNRFLTIVAACDDLHGDLHCSSPLCQGQAHRCALMARRSTYSG